MLLNLLINLLKIKNSKLHSKKKSKSKWFHRLFNYCKPNGMLKSTLMVLKNPWTKFLINNWKNKFLEKFWKLSLRIIFFKNFSNSILCLKSKIFLCAKLHQKLNKLFPIYWIILMTSPKSMLIQTCWFQ